MATPDGKLRVVFNGEIYNYPELRKALEDDGYVFRSHSDTEALLHLYRRDGPAMVQRLRGMFAFALWDEDRQGLLLARDGLGIKPLYYADDGNTLRVASQVKALLAGGTDRAVDPAGHVGFFLWGHVPEPHTLYSGVRALPAGTTLWAERFGGIGPPRRYFHLVEELVRAETERTRSSPAEIAERFSAALGDSVRCHMLADVPVGVFLSSGLDSASIATVAREYTDEPLRTVTLGFSEFLNTQEDEVPLAELVAQRLGFAQRTCRVSEQDFATERERLLTAMDQPTIDGVNTYFVSKAAHEAGLKVTLSGLGGDELLGGYPSFQQIPTLVRYAAPWRVLGKGFRVVTAPCLRHFTPPKYAGILEYGGTYGGAYLLRRGLYMPWELSDVLDTDLVREGWRELDTLARLEATTASIASPALRVSALETCWYMRNQLLRDTDWASMAHSLEVRVPLVDIEIIRCVARLQGGPLPVRKALLSNATRKLLPEAVLNRPKTGFAIPVRQWLARANEHSDHRLRGWAKTVYRSLART
jgi:asparagine synthase (glutamine-hydrolysing)